MSFGAISPGTGLNCGIAKRARGRKPRHRRQPPVGFPRRHALTPDPLEYRRPRFAKQRTALLSLPDTSLAERGHSCPQQRPNAGVGRFVARSPHSPLLRTGMSALRAKRVLSPVRAQGPVHSVLATADEGERWCHCKSR